MAALVAISVSIPSETQDLQGMAYGKSKLGFFDGLLTSAGTFKVEEDSKSVDINVHLYTSAVLSIPIGDGSIKLEQTTNWPWDGEIKFSLEAPADISRTIRLRIPGWATTWEINPSISHPSIEKGYLTLTTDWLRVNHQFRINIPLKPRLVSPHPYTNQNIVAVARGPIIYCLEDSDNPWVNDHFKVRCVPSLAQISR